MEDFVRVYQLFAFYGNLLTPKQRQAVDWYFGHDLSLAEISGELSISRQAVHDLLQRAKQALENYEAKLGLAEQHLQERGLWSRLCELLQEIQSLSPARVGLWQEVFNIISEFER